MEFLKGLKLAENLKNQGTQHDTNFIALAIVDIYYKHERYVEDRKKGIKSKPITQDERFLISLLYSEFLADTDSNDYDSELIRAAEKASAYRKILGIDWEELEKEVKRLAGWTDKRYNPISY
jgi:hypothetical protein